MENLILWPLIFLAFSVKLPLFPFHIWLPIAHVEAPTIGSIILAAILLKIGIYGLIKIIFPKKIIENYNKISLYNLNYLFIRYNLFLWSK